MKNKRKHWSEYPVETTCYGIHEYGIGVYRFDSDYKKIEFWLDYESASPEEIKKYEKYLEENNLES